MRPSLATVALVLVVNALAPTPSAQRSGAAAAPTKSTAQVAESTLPAVVTIVTRDQRGAELAQGSGFIVRQDGVIVTNWHVLAGASAATVTLKTGETFSRVSFLDGDQDADIALLKVPGYGLPVVRVVSDIPAVGSKVVTVGSPLGLSGTVSDGIVSAVRVVDGREVVQITAPISPGSSGGPVLDSTGTAFAISTLTIDTGQQLNFAMPVKYAMGLLSGTLKERPLADVFATAPPAAKNGASPTASRPQPTARPLASLVGNYVLTFDTGASALMVAADSDIGLVGIVGDKETSVHGLQTLRTNSAGEVAVGFGGIESGGFQTVDGFWASGTLKGKDEHGVETTTPFTYQARRYVPAISNDTGTYLVQCRTSYRDGSYTGPPVDWVGEAAILTANGRVYIDLRLKNAVGGSAGLYANGPIDGSGQFALVSGRQRLDGSIRAGAISAQWTDRRDGASYYFGPLTGERK